MYLDYDVVLDYYHIFCNNIAPLSNDSASVVGVEQFCVKNTKHLHVILSWKDRTHTLRFIRRTFSQSTTVLDYIILSYKSPTIGTKIGLE